MASRVLFNSQLTAAAKRAGVRYQTTYPSAVSGAEFTAQREAMKAHAGRTCLKQHYAFIENQYT